MEGKRAGEALLHLEDVHAGYGEIEVLRGVSADVWADEIVSIIGPNRKAIFVTVKVARSWESGNNNVIREGASRYPNVAVADWRGLSQTRVDFFWGDLIHLRPEGAFAYATLIAPFIK